MGKPALTTKLLAACCSACPFCILRRRWPRSAYGRFMGRIERCCPFCKAYDRLHETAPGVRPAEGPPGAEPTA